MTFNANLMRETHHKILTFADMEQREADADEGRVQAELALQEAQSEIAALRAERDELSRMCGQLLTEVRNVRGAGQAMLDARQLEAAAMRELLDYIALGQDTAAWRQRTLVNNAYAAMGVTDATTGVVRKVG